VGWARAGSISFSEVAAARVGRRRQAEERRRRRRGRRRGRLRIGVWPVEGEVGREGGKGMSKNMCACMHDACPSCLGEVA